MFSTLRTMLAKRREYREVAPMSREEFEEYKLAKFRRLVRHAKQRSPYYARIITEHGINPETAVPADFPPLTKSDLMANFDEISTVAEITKSAIAAFLERSKKPTDRFMKKYRVIHTSGSSGEVGYFVYSTEDFLRGASILQRPNFRTQRPQRKRKGKMRFAYYGATDGHYAGVTMMASVLEGPIAKLFVDGRLYEINSPLPEIIDALNEFQPDYIAGYTTALKILAEKQRVGILKLDSVMAIACAGEVTTENDRKILGDTFDCEVTNGYGSSEMLGMGAAMPGNEDMILFDEEQIYEIFEDHTLVTNLFNYTMPLIRYRMADILKPLADMSAYSPYLAVESLVGRSEIQPVFKNEDGVEDFISPHTINEIFVPGLSRFQLHLTADDAFRFLVCMDPTLSDSERLTRREQVETRLADILKRKRMANIRYEVAEVDDLPVNPKTRKFQLIVDDRQAA